MVFTGIVFGQMEFSEQYKEGIKALSAGKLAEAENYFKLSIRSNRDAASFNQLGLIYSRKGEIGSGVNAVDNLRQAALREPDNMKYRIDFANYLILVASASGMEEYERLISKNPKRIEPLLGYGNVLKEYYFEWNNAKKALLTPGNVSETDLSYYAQEYFELAEDCFTKVLKLDPSNKEALLSLGMLYEGTVGIAKSLEFVMRYLETNRNSQEAHLYAGMILNRMDKVTESAAEFKTAFALMADSEKEDYNYSSVVKLLEPKYMISEKKYSRQQIEVMINQFWKLSNPVLISDYNERLIEHYSRVAYANIHFSTDERKTNGWKTDKGELIIRFGLPVSISKTIPYMDPRSSSIVPKNELWNFHNARVSFIDSDMNGMYKMKIDYKGAPNTTKTELNPFQNMKNLNQLQFYIPRVKLFKLPIDFYCFRNSDENVKEPDAYVAYQIPSADSLYLANKTKSYSIGIYEFDTELKPVVEKKEVIGNDLAAAILREKRNTAKIDNFKFAMPLFEAALKFEILRDADTSYFSYHAVSEGNKFYLGTPDLSDIVLASAIETGESIAGAIKRGDFSILPNINRLAKNTEPVFIYYEVYNLRKNNDNLTDFTQTIRIKEYSHKEEERSLVGSLINLIAGEKERVKELNLTSSYKTQEASPQQYVQIDFNEYPTGTYEIFIKIKDNITGSETEKRQVIGILNEK
jgi:GWxTD domain-containing protein